ncbi:MAG: alkaline phosphatase family protein [Clostridia bacterium]|nr:alkaline phosphatase family protein [Clostridia bacterium]
MKKVLLILVDGMRPDALTACGHPFAKQMLETGRCFLQAQTVMPSVTLPCHMSLFHSVTPDRHGILTNTYVPQVRPVRGLCETLRAAGKTCAMFYNWEELKDLSRPDALTFGCYVSGHVYGYEEANPRLTAIAKAYLTADAPDFAFVYLGWSDAAGHKDGWMSEDYLRAVRGSWDCIAQLCDGLSEDYLVIVTADHGGHARSHGSDLPEDMTIPILCSNAELSAGKPAGGSILDLAPTVCAVLGVAPDAEWEGAPLPLEAQ